MILLEYNYIKPHYINLMCLLAGDEIYDIAAVLQTMNG